MFAVQLKSFLKSSKIYNIGKNKNLWAYVDVAFNKVDADRLKLVGPDRLCAEWILKNGGAVSFVQVPGKFLRDYNSLPPQNNAVQVKAIDASNSSIMKIGLDHFIGCKHLDQIIFHECKHLEEDGLDGLHHVKDTLHHLQISGCSNIPDKGLMTIKELGCLKTLKIFDMQYVQNMDTVAKELKAYLPIDCTIDIKP